MRTITIASLIAPAVFSTFAHADLPEPPEPTTLPPPHQAQPASSGSPGIDGFRWRHGLAFSAGEEYGSGPSSGLSGTLIGGDWRIGGQLDDDYAIYVDSHLSFGTAHIGASSGVTGNIAVAAIAERTFVDRAFVGAGGGYGVLNNPSGPLAQVRAGFYPFVGHAVDRARRTGLMIGADARFYFAGPAIGTVTQLSITLGFERF